MPLISKKTLFIAPLFMVLACGQDKANSQQQATTTQTPTEATQSRHHSGEASQSTQGDPAASIPDFTFYILKSGIRFEKSDIKSGDKHVFILFDPSCSYCQHEARDIGQNIDKFPNTSFYFISMNDPGLMSTFFDSYAKELNDRSNVHMLYDRDMEFINRFHIPTQYPATYIYSNNGLLETFWNGVKPTDEVVKAIQN